MPVSYPASTFMPRDKSRGYLPAVPPGQGRKPVLEEHTELTIPRSYFLCRSSAVGQTSSVKQNIIASSCLYKGLKVPLRRVLYCGLRSADSPSTLFSPKRLFSPSSWQAAKSVGLAKYFLQCLYFPCRP